MQGVRRNSLASSSPTQRSRYCRRCGAPLALAPGSMSGVRCSNCGAAPGIPVRTVTDLLPNRVDAPKIPGPYVAVPMDLGSSPAPPVRRAAVASPTMRERAQPFVMRLRGWVAELPELTPRTWITAAAAGIAIAIAFAVVLAVG